MYLIDREITKSVFSGYHFLACLSAYFSEIRDYIQLICRKTLSFFVRNIVFTAPIYERKFFLHDVYEIFSVVFHVPEHFSGYILPEPKFFLQKKRVKKQSVSLLVEYFSFPFFHDSVISL